MSKHKSAREKDRARDRLRHRGNATKRRNYYAKVAKRDKWKCWICGLKVDPDLDKLHDRGGSLDHVVPYSQGGEHTLENLRLAHRDCNNIRANGC